MTWHVALALAGGVAALLAVWWLVFSVARRMARRFCIPLIHEYHVPAGAAFWYMAIVDDEIIESQEERTTEPVRFYYDELAAGPASGAADDATGIADYSAVNEYARGRYYVFVPVATGRRTVFHAADVTVAATGEGEETQ